MFVCLYTYRAQGQEVINMIGRGGHVWRHLILIQPCFVLHSLKYIYFEKKICFEFFLLRDFAIVTWMLLISFSFEMFSMSDKRQDPANWIQHSHSLWSNVIDRLDRSPPTVFNRKKRTWRHGDTSERIKWFQWWHFFFFPFFLLLQVVQCIYNKHEQVEDEYLRF